MKILLVDDDKDDQMFFTDALSEIAPKVDCGIANNGMEAIHHLQKIPPPPTVIFLDLNMPYMNGFECLSAIKTDNNYKNIPVIIFSTSSNTADRDKSMAMGATAFITKPSDFSNLKMQISQVLIAMEP